MNSEKKFKVAFLGSPNVGKSTLYNALTSMKQHTGNWTGKTVEVSSCDVVMRNRVYELVDLPGTYSLSSLSEDEMIANEYIKTKEPDCVVVVCDATALKRTLNLVYEVKRISSRVVVCINLCDEARKKEIEIDSLALSEILSCPVVKTSAINEVGLVELKNAIIRSCDKSDDIKIDKKIEGKKIDNATLDKIIVYKNKDYYKKDKKIDKILTNKLTAIPIMVGLLAVVLYITLFGANYLSEMLANLLFAIERELTIILGYFNLPLWVNGVFVEGMYRTLAWVVSVMLPPMTIFFPMFTYLEELGYLPRIAFNLDEPFRKANTCGKQSLCMCMGLGCNAVGVVSSRIISSPKEKLISILTNTFMPCNGRFPSIILVVGFFCVVANSVLSSTLVSTLVLTAIIIFAVIFTFAISKILSKTVLKGENVSFYMEMPPFRKPKLKKILYRSLIDRTLKILKRALIVSAPAGVIIWILSNIQVNDFSLYYHTTQFLNPLGQLMGLDGVILIAFLFAFPANEILIPLMIMGYMMQTSLSDTLSTPMIYELFRDNGWTLLTAINTIIFIIFHFPCGTTLLTIHNETKSLKWTAFAFFMPLIVGIALCMTSNLIFSLF